MMTGQHFYQKNQGQFDVEEPLFIRLVQGHSGEDLDIELLSHKKIEKGYASFFFHIGCSRNEEAIRSGGLVPGYFGGSIGRNAVYFSLVSPFDTNRDPKYKPYIHMKNHNDRLYVIDLEEAQNSLDFYQTANGSV